jgi:hypothetical protein
MHESLYAYDGRPRRFRATFTAFPTHVKQLEAEQSLFLAWQDIQRRKQFVRLAGKLWPIAAGLLLGLFAPELRALMMKFEPWGMWLVFPFALLAGQPEFRTIAQAVHNLPLVVLYLQFPVEGLIVLLALRRRVTVPAVAGRVFYLHYLAALQLLMIGAVVVQSVWR